MSAWSDSGSNYLHNPTLSEEMRVSLQKVCRFRQFCDVEAAVGKNRGEKFTWNVYGDTQTQGGELQESAPIPETSFPISQGSVTMTERGISVPYSGKLEALSEHDIRRIIFKVLKNDANRSLDTAAHAQFDSAILRYVGTGATSYNWDDDGTATGNNNSGLVKAHIKTISDLMSERGIPTYDGENYISIGRASTFRPFRDEIESSLMYTQDGYNRVVNGEIGRFEGFRFVTQSNIAAEANWATNGLSDAAYFFGEQAACNDSSWLIAA